MQQETYEKIICFFAHRDKDATQYNIKKDNEVNLTYAPINQAIKHLLFADLIEETRQENGKGPLPKRYFKLTFSGFVTALALLSVSKTDDSDHKVRSDVRKVILAQRSFFPEAKVFSEWESLENAFCDRDGKVNDERVYDNLVWAAVYCFDKFLPLERASWLMKEFPDYIDKPEAEREKLKKSILRDYRITQRTFLRVFFHGLLFDIERGLLNPCRGNPRNKVLCDFVAAFFEAEKQRKMASIKKLEKNKKLLLKQFAAVNAT